MKFFVSGKVGAENEARSAMEALKDAGHQITFDWTTIEHLKPYDKNPSASQEAAIKEVNGVKNADVLVIIAHDDGVGMYVELGIAIAVGIPIRVVTTNKSRSLFYHHPLVKLAKSVEEIIQEFSCN